MIVYLNLRFILLLLLFFFYYSNVIWSYILFRLFIYLKKYFSIFTIESVLFISNYVISIIWKLQEFVYFL